MQPYQPGYTAPPPPSLSEDIAIDMRLVENMIIVFVHSKFDIFIQAFAQSMEQIY